MRVRIARSMHNSPDIDSPGGSKPAPAAAYENGYDTNIFDNLHLRNGIKHGDAEGGKEGVGIAEQKVLDRVGEDLARLGRVKRVGLGVQDKVEFVKMWRKRERLS